MKKLIAATVIAMTATAATAQEAEEVSISTLTSQGKVLLASHFTDVTEIATLILGTVEGGPEYICRTRMRGGSGYDVCRKFE